MKPKLLIAVDPGEAKRELLDRVERNTLGFRQRIGNVAYRQDTDQYNKPTAVQRHKLLGNPKRFFSNNRASDRTSLTQVE